MDDIVRQTKHRLQDKSISTLKHKHFKVLQSTATDNNFVNGQKKVKNKFIDDQ